MAAAFYQHGAHTHTASQWKWEFLDHGRHSNCWREYQPTEQQKLEASFQELVHTGACALVQLGHYVVSIDGWIQENQRTRFKRFVRRCLRNPGAKALQNVWLWEDGRSGSGQWRPYSHDVCAELDAATLEKTPLAIAEFGTKPALYYVDLKQMVQVNKSTMNSRRVHKVSKAEYDRSSLAAGMPLPMARAPAPMMTSFGPTSGALPAPGGSLYGLAGPAAGIGMGLSVASAPGMPFTQVPAAPVGSSRGRGRSKRSRGGGTVGGAVPAMSSVVAFPKRTRTEARSGNTIAELNIPFRTPELSEEDECCICMDRLCESEESGLHAIQLGKCQGHAFHMECLDRCINKGSLKCPICAAIYGNPITGTQPPGTMSVSIMQQACPGFEGHDTFVIKYDLPSGTQTADHPDPGSPFQGTSRVGLIPTNEQGKQVVQLLQVAWERKLIFQVGHSITLGEAAGYRVTWNGIHHKTGFRGEHGYPDATYLDRVTQELAAVGVLYEDIAEE